MMKGDALRKFNWAFYSKNIAIRIKTPITLKTPYFIKQVKPPQKSCDRLSSSFEASTFVELPMIPPLPLCSTTRQGNGMDFNGVIDNFHAVFC